MPQNISKEDFHYFNDGNIIDENGTLLSDTSYVFVTVDVTNNRTQEASVCWNACNFIILDKDNKLSSPTYDISAWEARYCSGRERYTAADYYIQPIQPGETKTFTVGYILEDKWIDSDQLYYYVHATDLQSIFYEKIQAFKVNE